MRKLIIPTLVAGAAALVLASPAHADPQSYIDSLGTHGLTVYNTRQALITGYEICAALNTTNGVDVVNNVFTRTTWADVPDKATAFAMVEVAVEELCPWHDHRGPAAADQQPTPTPQGGDGSIGGAFRT